MMIAHGEFGRQTPAGTAMGVPMQFEVIDYCAASAKNSLVLVSIELGQFLGENFLDMASEQFLFIAATATFDEGLVDGDVTATSVFDKKCGVGNVIKELLDNA
jgi:hypothetical protein